MVLKFFILFANILSIALAILCRAGVDQIEGPLADCGESSQCMNTTSSQATVFSCDYGGICDVILNLQNGCILDGPNRVCCCSTGDECNFGGLPLSGTSKWTSSNKKHNESGASTAKSVSGSMKPANGASPSNVRNLPEEASKMVKSSLLDSTNF